MYTLTWRVLQVPTYVRTYTCVYGRIWIEEWMDEWTDGRMSVGVYVFVGAYLGYVSRICLDRICRFIK